MRTMNAVRRFVTMTAVLFLAYVGSLAATAAPAAAASGPRLTLSQDNSMSYARWSASGSGYAWGRTDVTIWVMDVTGGGS
jgi:hypothetical protein